jgi:hypothetical protein
LKEFIEYRENVDSGPSPLSCQAQQCHNRTQVPDHIHIAVTWAVKDLTRVTHGSLVRLRPCDNKPSTVRAGDLAVGRPGQLRHTKGDLNGDPAEDGLPFV